MFMKKLNCILTVDDNPTENTYHKIQITEADICNHIQIANSGRQALDYLIKGGEPNQSEEFPKPQLIFLDMHMPSMNGFEFLEEYHKLDERLKSKVVIIMLTTSLSPNDKARAMTYFYKQITEFQNKPLTIKMLHEIVEKHF